MKNAEANLLALYKFNDASCIGKDYSGNENNAIALGTEAPVITDVCGRTAALITGGPSGTSYFELPEAIIDGIRDDSGLTVSTWIYLRRRGNPWERILDLGKAGGYSNLFITRNLRTVCAEGEDLTADALKPLPINEWIHIAVSITGSKGGTLSSAGAELYINGDLVCDGKISQTTSGKYGKLRKWFASFEDRANYPKRYIGKSLYDVDPNFDGALSDFRIYSAPLSQDDIIELMCTSLSDETIVGLARDKYLKFPQAIITKDADLPKTLMGGKVEVVWNSDNTSALSNDGVVGEVTSPQAVTLTATLKRGESTVMKSSSLTVLPNDVPPYTLTINGNDRVVDISKTLWGLFYEDINNAADGGIYAELIQNRSFENFTFKNYNHSSGENGITEGRVHNPLFAWFGDTDKMHPQSEGGLNDFFGLEDKDINSYYVTVDDGAVIYNRGFCDNNKLCSMDIKSGENYNFTIWAKGKASIDLVLVDSEDNSVSNQITVNTDSDNWKKYGVDEKLVLTGTASKLSQLKMTFHGNVAIDMVSLFPENVWGAKEEPSSATAHANHTGNPNYRLRKDLVEALVGLHPTFLRFPGGCISEGSYIWDNVYDWKDSVDDVELRKENFNVWGYAMTMGLGYMEYFQLAEDLNATPLPVMACGVLCQARSDYANPAGGALQKKYIKNFTDLIDFAINTDYENNIWAALRKKMGHAAPFDLHYLGIGNENWGPEFMASFEIFYEEITAYVKKNYPGYELNVISTVGAQADDDAYRFGWKFLSGNMTGTAKVSFTDGKTSTEEEVSWYKYQKHFMETIADEHYYRSNDYLLNNADRYNYYFRSFNADGTVNDALSSKVFVGEYASSDKNTLAGAVAEAAVMTGFENNSDVVRLAATAPLFNKVLTDGQYRWTPDCIWFDNQSVWYTPTYYVQQLFAKYVGKKVLSTSFKTYVHGKEYDLIPRGGVEIATCDTNVIVKSVKVISNVDGSVILDADLSKGLPEGFELLPVSPISGTVTFETDGMHINAEGCAALTGIYTLKDLRNYKVEVNAVKTGGNNGLYVGVGVTDISTEKKNATEYVIGQHGNVTGIKVYKNGVEGYRLGDFSSSEFAGNLRSSINEDVNVGTAYTINVDFGTKSGKNLVCSYTDGSWTSFVHDYKLEAYNNFVFNSVTEDESNIYIKLVNADAYNKSTKVVIKDAVINATAETVLITADSKYAHTNNVNEKDNEVVVPVLGTIDFDNNETVITLPANSVTCVILKKN
ncbi:MAG: alpha-L-arabinofuranosidase [Lachnospiraceae bacterium]|nr:alpha-L-arabinofuranosidase [Lachnospiraceae bacterium]